MKQTTLTEPDLVIETKDRYKDKLSITVYPDHVEFSALLDGCGNIWKVDRKKLKEII